MPPPRVVTGTIAELEAALAGDVAAERSRAPLAPVTVLVGHVLLRPYLRRALAMRGVAQLNVRYLRPHELAQEMAARATAAQPMPRLTRAAERMLARDVAATAGGYFAAVRGRDGFVEALQRLFRELEDGGFTPQSFTEAVRESGNSDKSRELATLFDAYVSRRARLGVTGAADDARAAMDAPFEGPLFVYGAWSLANTHADLLARIAERAPVTVYLATSALDADAAHEALRDRLRDMDATFEHARPVDDGAIAAVARRLFASAPPPANGAGPPHSGDIALINAPDTVREVWEAARACLRWAEQGIRFHEMAVVYRNRDPYRALVDEIFSEAGIETYLHDGRLLSEHPLGRRVLSLLDLASDAGFSRAKVMEFLTETQLPRETRQRHETVRPSEWEALTREAGVVEGIDQWRDRLTRLANEKRDLAASDERFDWAAAVADRIDALLRFVDEFHAALSSRRDEATWDEHLAFLRDITSQYAEGTAPIVEALEDLRQLEAVHERPSFETFARAVRDDLEWRDTTRVLGEPVRLFGRQGVAVIDATSVRHLRFRAVYMLGAAERAWPAPLRPDPLLLEHERRAINAAGSGELPLRTEPDDEPLGFWAAVQAARESLRVSFARADAGHTGKHLPSFFFRSLAEAVEGRHGITIDELDGLSCVRRFAAGRLAADDLPESLSAAEYDRGIVKAANEGALPAGIQAIAEVTPPFRRAIAARRARHAASLSAVDGLMIAAEAVAAARALSAFAQGSLVSATRLEMYATCPYRYFLRHTLRVDPVEEPEQNDRMDHLQRGSLIHEILQRFMTATGRDDPPRRDARDRHLKLLQQLSDEAGEERVRRGVAGLPLVWQHDKRVIDEDLVRWYDREAAEIAASNLLPGAFEARFGPPGPGYGEEDPDVSMDEPLQLTVDGRQINVQGRIDRIDWDEHRRRFRVIDYKTGRHRARDADVFANGTSLQLAVYLRAAARMLGLDERDGEAEYFYATSAGEFKRHTLSGDTLVAVAADFERILSTIATGVDAGYFAPNPLKNAQNCQWCDYRDVCDAQIDRIMLKKEGDARSAAFIALREIP